MQFEKTWQKPNQDMIDVVCGVIFDQGKVFLCRRKPEKQRGGYWEFPGGKIEEAESPENALKRELKEELEMEIAEIRFFHATVHEYENITIRLLAFTCKFVASTYKMTDHDTFEWMCIEHLPNKMIAPADLPIVEKLLADK